jgi:hypothetical protein
MPASPSRQRAATETNDSCNCSHCIEKRTAEEAARNAWKRPYFDMLATAEKCLTLTQWEQDFIKSIRKNLLTRSELTMGQLQTLERLAAKAQYERARGIGR